MTFQSSYAKLLADPEFGHIKKRKEHAKQMYVDGMKALRDVHVKQFGYTTEKLEQAIAEESK